MQNGPNVRRGLALIAGLCVFALSTCWNGTAFAAQGAAVAAVNPKPETVSAPTTAAHPPRHAAPAKPSGRYFVEVRARTALSYGHAYVVYGQLDSKGRMINPQIGGIHPASTNVVPYMLGHFVPVPAEHGASDGDLDEAYVSARYRVILDQAQYNRVVAYIKELEASTPVWHAVLYSCISFVSDVAKAMGLRTPPTGMYPEVFIHNLRAMNNGRDEELTMVPKVQWGMAPAAPTAEEDPNATTVLSGSTAR